ncbi:hypothetical protein ScPMuIL_014315 [Solemya velum]
MNSQWLVIILVLSCMSLAVNSILPQEIYQKCSDDLVGCRKKTCKSVRGKKHHWVCLAVCWIGYQKCMSQLSWSSWQRYW